MYYCLANTTEKIFVYNEWPPAIAFWATAGGQVMSAMVRHRIQDAIRCILEQTV